MSDDQRDETLYRYPDSRVLRNKLDLRDASALAYAERMLVRQRMEEGCPTGDFDLPHLQDIHRHLFQDVYEWAGEIREVPLRKGSSQFFEPQRIGLAMQDIHARIKKQNYLSDLPADIFADEAGTILGDLNLVHPFREGNGRTQLIYLKQLSEAAGHEIDLTKIKRDQWIEASIEASRAAPNYNPLRQCIAETMPHLNRSYDWSQ